MLNNQKELYLNFNLLDRAISELGTRAGIESNNKTNVKVNNNIILIAAKDIQIFNRDRQLGTSFGIVTSPDKQEHPKGTIHLSYSYRDRQTDRLITKDKEIIQREVNNKSRLDNLVLDTRLLSGEGRSNIEDTLLDATDVILNTTDNAINLLTPTKKQQEQLLASATIIIQPEIVIPTAVIIRQGINRIREKVQKRREEKEVAAGMPNPIPPKRDDEEEKRKEEKDRKQPNLVEAESVGSADKQDSYHKAPDSKLVRQEILKSDSTKIFDIKGKDGNHYTLIQGEGSIDNHKGIFEYIVNDANEVTHQIFIEGGEVTGIPNNFGVK